MSKGVMKFTGQALKNLFSKPATTSYPFAPAEYKERTRGHIEIDENNCILCGNCMRNCPPGAITVDKPNLKWTIDRFDCIQCGYCTEKCPKKCLKLVPGYQAPGPDKHICTVDVPEPPKPAPKPPVAPAAPAAPAAKAPEAPKAEEKAEN